MRYVSVFVIILLMFSFGCRRKCHEKDIVRKNLNPNLKAYFGVFKKGNYWVYQNQDMTKKDSVYVATFDNSLFNENCTDTETLQFMLVSSGNDFISNGEDTSFYQTQGTDAITSGFNSLFPHSVDGLFFQTDTVYTNSSIGQTTRLSSKTLNAIIYTNEILEVYYMQDTIYFQKNIGVIGWKRNSDTYNLVNKYLQL